MACSHSANVAMLELGLAGIVSCGSVMVPSPWLPEIAGHPQVAELDLGVHLTLNSESVAFRWRPLSTASRASGMIDEDGFMWARVPKLRQTAVPEAVETELRTQIDTALSGGIDVTHLDHHMGAALAPEFVHSTVRIARDYRLPILFPSDLSTFVDVLDMGPVDLDVLVDARQQAGELAVGDTFVMGLSHQTDLDPRATFDRLLASLPSGVTYLSLHCSSPGDIEQVHPKDAHWRIAEYRLFRDEGFSTWLRQQSFQVHGMRSYRDALTTGS